jgi:hypothetical protein
MGSKSTKTVKTLESYTSFDVLPTEYFNRQSLQHQYQIKNQQLPHNYNPYNYQQIQPFISSDQYHMAQQNFYLPIQQQQQSPRLAFPQPIYNHQGEASQFLNIYNRNGKQQENKSYNNYNYHNLYKQDSYLVKRQLGLAPSSSQQIQSVPKFSQLSTMHKF